MPVLQLHSDSSVFKLIGLHLSSVGSDARVVVVSFVSLVGFLALSSSVVAWGIFRSGLTVKPWLAGLGFAKMHVQVLVGWVLARFVGDY